jgi:hypothetical protein
MRIGKPKDKSGAKEIAVRGAAGHGAQAFSALDIARVSQMLAPLPLTPEQIRQFPTIEGSDEEPWDIVLSMLAMDEHQGLELLSKRTGLRFVAEPRVSESSSRFYELVPADVARSRLVAGLESDGQVMTIATAQPMQPATFTML